MYASLNLLYDLSNTSEFQQRRSVCSTKCYGIILGKLKEMHRACIRSKFYEHEENQWGIWRTCRKYHSPQVTCSMPLSSSSRRSSQHPVCPPAFVHLSMENFICGDEGKYARKRDSQLLVWNRSQIRRHPGVASIQLVVVKRHHK